jgi:hypothetical protein
MQIRRLFLTLLACGSISLAAADATRIAITADQPLHPVSPMLWGIFFEDINCSADGGLYAELVRNRNFQDSENPDHWSALSNGAANVTMAVATNHPVSDRNPRYLRVEMRDPGAGRVGIAHQG